MTKIDHFLATTEWLEIFPRIDLQALASLGSDHCPLFLQGDTSLEFYRGFRFEAYWINMPSFMDTVKIAWEQPVNTQNALLRMHVKLVRTARALKIWRRTIFSEWKLKSAFLQIILLELEKAQERRILTPEEHRSILRLNLWGWRLYKRQGPNNIRDSSGFGKGMQYSSIPYLFKCMKEKVFCQRFTQ
jgi:hypothetical protein